MRTAIRERVKNMYGLWRCAILNCAVKWDTWDCQKMHWTSSKQIKAVPAKPQNWSVPHLPTLSRTASIMTVHGRVGCYVKTMLGLWRCSDIRYCCKMAPLQLPKVASNRFMEFEDHFIHKKLEIYLFPTLMPRCALRGLGLGPGLFGRVSETLLVWGGVATSDFAVKWLPCSCQKLHPTVLRYLQTNSCKKIWRFIPFPHSSQGINTIEWVQAYTWLVACQRHIKFETVCRFRILLWNGSPTAAKSCIQPFYGICRQILAKRIGNLFLCHIRRKV